VAYDRIASRCVTERPGREGKKPAAITPTPIDLLRVMDHLSSIGVIYWTPGDAAAGERAMKDP
jgi:hypothetical protein